MPKLSRGLDYYDMDTSFLQDRRVKLFKAEFGMKGLGIWVYLLAQIYGDEGYYMVWDNDTRLLFASDVGESDDLLEEVVKGLVRRGLFNETVFNSFNVLTSKHIQEKYFYAIKRRSTDTEVDARYLVIPLNDNLIQGNVNIKLLNVNIKIQRREEDRKEENSREESTPAQDGPYHKPDSKEQVIEFFQNNGGSSSMAEDFYLHFEGQGWVRKNSMAITSWHAVASKWIKTELQKITTDNQNQQSNGYNSKTKADRAIDFLTR